MEQELRTQLIAVADAYQTSAQALSERTIGHRQLRNEDWIQGVRDGKRGFNIRKFDQLMCWYSENWPDDCLWPAHVSLPILSKHSPSVAAEGAGQVPHG